MKFHSPSYYKGHSSCFIVKPKQYSMRRTFCPRETLWIFFSPTGKRRLNLGPCRSEALRQAGIVTSLSTQYEALTNEAASRIRSENGLLTSRLSEQKRRQISDKICIFSLVVLLSRLAWPAGIFQQNVAKIVVNHFSPTKL